MKRAVFGSILAILALFGPRLALAALPTNQPLTTSVSNSGNGAMLFQQPLGATSTWSGTISSVSMYLRHTTTSETFYVLRICPDNGDPFGTSFCGTTGSFATSSVIEETSGLHTFNFGTPFVIPATGTIKVSGCTQSPSLASSTGYDCASGQSNPGGISSQFYVTSTPIGWPEYPLYWNLVFNATTTASIDFAYPVAATTTPDRFNWQFLISGLDNDPDFSCSPSSPCALSVSYWRGTSTTIPDIHLTDYDQIISTDSPLLWTMQMPWPLLSDNFSAQAFLESNEGGLTIFSPVITFAVGSSTVPGGVSASTTIASTTISCNSGNWFSDGLCGSIAYLFIPDPAYFQNILSIEDLVSSKPPVGYFVLARDSFLNLSVGTSSRELISTSTSAALDDVFSPLRTGIASILWVLFGLWVIHRIGAMHI